MENNRFPYLCGGTFFVLLLQARPPRRKARDKQKGGSDGLSNPDALTGLIKVFTGSGVNIHHDSLEKATSEFKECKPSASDYIPFNNQSRISSFNTLIKTEYATLIKRMKEFTDTFIDTNMKEFLVKAILEVIKDDESISGDAEFFIGENYTVKKEELICMNSFTLQPFLLGVLHFILNNRTDNESGRYTIEKWGTKSADRAPRKFDDYPFGQSITQDITVSLYEPEQAVSESSCTKDTPDNASGDHETESKETVQAGKSSSEIIEEKIMASGKVLADTWEKVMDALAEDMQSRSPDQDAEPVEAEVVEDEEVLQDPTPQATTQITNIQHQSNVVQNGETNINIEHVENLKL